MRWVILFDGLGSEVRNTSVFAAILSIIFLVVFYWWFRGDLALTAAYAGLSVLATLSVPFIYRLAGFTLADEVEWLESRELKDHQAMLARLDTLEQQLDDLGIEEGVNQARTLTAILDDYHKVVETRFLGKKQAPVAYLSTARRVQKHAIQNLTDAVAVGHSLASISRHGESDKPNQRLEGLNTDQSGRLKALMAENRDLFGALTDTAVEVANIRSYSDYERLDTMARLVSLAEIANRTGK